MALLPLLAIALAGLLGCSKDDKPTGALPEGATLLTEASTAMRDVTTAHIKIETQGELGPATAAPGRR